MRRPVVWPVFGAEIEPPLPEPDTDPRGDYLSDEWLEALARRPFQPREAAEFLIKTFPHAVSLMWCPSIEVTEVDDDIYGPCHRVRFATGGWSGAEELIEIVLSHFWMRQHYNEWHAGGLYIFLVAKHWLEVQS